MAWKVSRRQALGYAGAAGLGGAAGALGHRAFVGAQAEEPATGPVGQTYSAYGQQQAGIFTPKPAVGELVALDLLPETDPDALGRLLRVWSTDLAALMAGRPAAGDTAPELAQAGVSLTILVGFGLGVFELEGLGPRRPAGFQEIPAMTHDRLAEHWSGGDLLVWVSADDGLSVAHAMRRMILDAAPFAKVRWRQAGTWRPVDAGGQPVTGRNLFGQVDGTANPTGDVLTAAVISDDDWLAGGTQLVVRRIEMDLDAWDRATRARQEATIGRDLAKGAPLTGTAEHDDLDLAAERDGQPVIALDAHARRAHPTQNAERRMLRRGLNYTHTDWVDGAAVETSGLIFTAFVANIADQFIPVQRTLDEKDALNEWTTAIGSAVFAIPPGFSEGGFVGETLLPN